MTSEEILAQIKSEPMREDTLTDLTQPYHNQLAKQGELRDNDTITDKQIKPMQTPVTSAVNGIVKLRLQQELYRKKWEYKDTLRADKWVHKDTVREMKRARKELVAARNAAAKAAKAEKKAAVKAAKKAKSEKGANVSNSSKAKIHTRG